MAERWDVVDLESALVDVGRHLAFPPTPDLARRVLPLRRAERRAAWQRLFQHPVRVAFAGLLVVLLALVGILAYSPEVRTAVAERLGLRGVPITQVTRVPSLAPAPFVSPTVQYGAGLDLGEPTTLDGARSRLPLLLPSGAELEQPDAVYLSPTSLGGTVSVVYGSRPGLGTAPETGVSLLLLESRLPPSGFQPAILGKSAGPETLLEEVSVNGGRGVWLEGAPHVLLLPDANGAFNQDRVRLAGNVLLWEQSGLLIRLEGTFSQTQALQIAATIH
jgi:hypothetical protein